VIREAVGETAYASGKFAEALAELRTARRLSGGHDYAPMMADCERALGRPQKALEYDRPEVRAALDDAGEVELTIVVAGARRDLGQAAAALRMLESEPLHSPSREPWLARLRYAYADTLLSAGRRDEAVEWFHRTLAVDSDGVTDAEERLADLD
jgi:tetratricopeptide (TPR) repeat protein